jgi:hypothetical protein
MDKSLLQRREGWAGEPRFVMLETVREYAHARLQASEQAAAVRDSHLVFFLELAESIASQSNALDPAQLACLEQEHDNLRAAFQWALEREDAGSMARLTDALISFGDLHGHGREGLQWLEAVVARRRQLPARTQAALLTDYGGAVAYAGDYTRAQQIYEEAAAQWRALGDMAGLAWTTCLMGGNAEYREEYAQAEALWQEGLDLFRRSGSGDLQIAWALYGLGGAARLQGNVSRAAELLAESLALQRANDQAEPAWTLVRAGQVALL